MSDLSCLKILHVKIWSIITLLIIITLLSGCSSNAKILRSDDYSTKNFSLSNIDSFNDLALHEDEFSKWFYPKDWMISTDYVNGVVDFAVSHSSSDSDEIFETISMAHAKLDMPGLDEKYAKDDVFLSVYYITEYKLGLPTSVYNFQFIDESSITVNNVPASRIIYLGTYDKNSVRKNTFYEVYFVKNGILYKWLYFGNGEDYNRYLPYAEKSLNSIVIKT